MVKRVKRNIFLKDNMLHDIFVKCIISYYLQRFELYFMTNMNFFEPVNKEHAIVECVFFAEFMPSFSDSILQRLFNLKETLQDDLPNTEEVRAFGGNFNPAETANVHFTNKQVGLNLQRIKPDGQIGWALKITENSISVHCLDYTRWQNILPKTMSFLSKAFQNIEGLENDLSKIGLRYVDRFVYHGSEENYKVSYLFKENNSYLPQRIYESHLLWHTHLGWFETIEKNKKNLPCLNQMNIDSLYMSLLSSRKLITNIAHNMIINLDNLKNKTEYFDFSDIDNKEKSIFCDMMEHLHNVNKDLMSNLLAKDIKQKINLGV